jgi:hypothetical protein
MRTLSLTASAAALAMVFATAADARPTVGAARAGSDASSSTGGKAVSLIEAVAALFDFSASAKATPVAGSERPRSASPVTEQCEEEKKRSEAAKAAETRRTAEAEKRQRGAEPMYLAF